MNNFIPEQVERDMRLLQLMSKSFPNIERASSEIINLEAIQNLPKGTEHFVADIHGEHQAFLHILRNASGNIRRKVNELFGETLTADEIRDLCTLIYYPEQKMEIVEAQESDLATWYGRTLFRLVQVCRSVTSKYTRSKVRKALPTQYAYIIEELLHENPFDEDKDAYFGRIIESIVHTGQGTNFIVAICQVIHALSIDQLHILGDIYDRGPGAHIIMDYLLHRQNFDVQWGNHDCLWMGAAAGNDCCIATVLRLSLRYGNMATLEDGYGINLLPLATFAMATYGDDPCTCFQPHLLAGEASSSHVDVRLMAQMHKAITIIQFKLEHRMKEAHPEWRMGSRGTLDYVDYVRGTYTLDGRDYEMRDTLFPTVDPLHPFELSGKEADLVDKLRHSFRVSDKLQKHIRCLFQHGCMYKVCNGNLLFHASIPLNEDGTMKEVELRGERYSGKDLMHHIGMMMRSAFQTDTPDDERRYACDYFWYLWCGPDSPLFDKDRMTTFERYFLADKALHAEKKGYYYIYRDNPQVCEAILDAFGVEGQYRHIINGHVPVHASQGENPVKAGGKLMVIDGGFSAAYHKTTGIAGYTLVYHSRGFQLIQHEPFQSTAEAVRNGTDIKSSTQIVEMTGHRMRVRDTDKGRSLQQQIEDLYNLLYAYRHGLIPEQQG